MQTKQYLGDGIWAVFDGYGITLTRSNAIYLRPEVYEALTDYVKRIKESQQKKTEGGSP